jgi:hypothetical protein
MITDDLVALKAGVLVAKIQQPGSVIDQFMSAAIGQKRQIVKEARVGNVISIAPDESIESLNFQNLEGPFTLARKDILENIAAGADMPAIMVNSDTFAGDAFAEGSEDFKKVAQYIGSIREWLVPVFEFFDNIIQYAAWTPEFYATIQRDFPEYQEIDFNTAFYKWKNNFKYSWPSLLIEPESDLIKVEESKLKGIFDAIAALAPLLDPDNKAKLIMWAADSINQNKTIFPHPLVLDQQKIVEFGQQQVEQAAQEQQTPPEGPKAEEQPPETKSPDITDSMMIG